MYYQPQRIFHGLQRLRQSFKSHTCLEEGFGLKNEKGFVDSALIPSLIL